MVNPAYRPELIIITRHLLNSNSRFNKGAVKHISFIAEFIDNIRQ